MPKTIHNWVDKGKLAAFRTPGRHLRFEPEKVHAFLKEYGYPIPASLIGKLPTPEAVVPKLSLRQQEILLHFANGVFKVAGEDKREIVAMAEMGVVDQAMLEQGKNPLTPHGKKALATGLQTIVDLLNK